MMCDPCKLAGRELAAGRTPEHVARIHRDCAYVQCTCQHVTETVLARPKVTA